MTQKEKENLINYIYEYAGLIGKYYHTLNPFERANELMQSPEEFVENEKT